MSEIEKNKQPLEIDSEALRKAFDAVSEYSPEFDDYAFGLILQAHIRIHGKNQNLM